ncbi:hypothetical protein OTU49_005860, partial [Cherax quadricarinatus]
WRSQDAVLCVSCFQGPKVEAISVLGQRATVFLHVTQSFTMKISMELEGCYSHVIFRGNHYITRDNLSASSSHDSWIEVQLIYSQQEGIHMYEVKVLPDNFTSVINSSITCGKFVAFSLTIGKTDFSICNITGQDMLQKLATPTTTTTSTPHTLVLTLLRVSMFVISTTLVVSVAALVMT